MTNITVIYMKIELLLLLSTNYKPIWMNWSSTTNEKITSRAKNFTTNMGSAVG
jgi:ABC-type transporter lipoprotein component MlaA